MITIKGLVCVIISKAYSSELGVCYTGCGKTLTQPRQCKRYVDARVRDRGVCVCDLSFLINRNLEVSSIISFLKILHLFDKLRNNYTKFHKMLAIKKYKKTVLMYP